MNPLSNISLTRKAVLAIMRNIHWRLPTTGRKAVWGFSTRMGSGNRFQSPLVTALFIWHQYGTDWASRVVLSLRELEAWSPATRQADDGVAGADAEAGASSSAAASVAVAGAMNLTQTLSAAGQLTRQQAHAQQTTTGLATSRTSASLTPATLLAQDSAVPSNSHSHVAEVWRQQRDDQLDREQRKRDAEAIGVARLREIRASNVTHRMVRANPQYEALLKELGQPLFDAIDRLVRAGAAEG
jgi:hypothetical protein